MIKTQNKIHNRDQIQRQHWIARHMMKTNRTKYTTEKTINMSNTNPREKTGVNPGALEV